MRRTGLALLFTLLFALGGGASAAVFDGPPTTTTSTTTTTATTPSTTTTATTTTSPTTTVTPPSAQVLPPSVRVGGVPVGGLTPTAAFLALQGAFPQTVRIAVAGRQLVAARADLGATDYLWNAIAKAKTSPASADVPVTTVVKGAAVRGFVARLAKRFDRAPRDAQLRLRALKPVLTKDRAGFRVQQGPAAATLVAALKAHDDGPVALPAQVVRPRVARAGFGPVIVIHRGSNQLDLYRGERLWRQFTVATGQKIYPTPLGRFAIVAMWKNPWWYPPNSKWAAGEQPVPPGPGNPLGTRWMGISSPGVGIHGTPDAASLGYSASHGCVRMAIPQAEWLFDHVAVGTPVYIVPA